MNLGENTDSSQPLENVITVVSDLDASLTRVKVNKKKAEIAKEGQKILNERFIEIILSRSQHPNLKNLESASR